MSETAAALESPEVESAKTINVVGDLTVGDVPGLVVSIAVEGSLPEKCFEGRGGGDWLQAALTEAFRRDGGPAESEDGSGGERLPAQVGVLGCPVLGQL